MIETDPEFYLREFQKWEQRYPGPCPWSVTLDFKEHARHAVFGSIVHGNETGSLPAVLATLGKLHTKKIIFGGKVTFFLGNPQACKLGLRFLEADLNRVFTDSAANSAESRRARELMPLLRSADVFFDFHQTAEICPEPFYIFAYHLPSYLWARAVQQAKLYVTRKTGTSFATHQCCCDEFARNLDIPAVTLELGLRGITSNAAQISEAAMVQVLALLNSDENLAAKAYAQPDFRFFEIVHRETFKSPHSILKPGLYNFTQVTAGENLGTTEAEPFFAPTDGVIIFPKYPSRDENKQAVGQIPSEIYQLAVELKMHPRDLWN